MDKPEIFGHFHLVYHLTVPLNVAFLKNWTTTEKGCPLHFEIYDKEKLRSFPETSFNSPLNQIFEFFCYYTKRLMGFLYLLILSPCFVSLCPSFCDFEDFFKFFFQASYNYLYSNFLFWENILLLINVLPRQILVYTTLNLSQFLPVEILCKIFFLGLAYNT